MKPNIVPVAVNIYSRAERPVSFGLEGQRETLQCASKGTEREEGSPGSICSTGVGELVARWFLLGQEAKGETLTVRMVSTRSKNQRLKVGYLVCALWKGGKQNQGLHLAFPFFYFELWARGSSSKLQTDLWWPTGFPPVRSSAPAGPSPTPLVSRKANPNILRGSNISVYIHVALNRPFLGTVSSKGGFHEAEWRINSGKLFLFLHFVLPGTISPRCGFVQLVKLTD